MRPRRTAAGVAALVLAVAGSAGAQERPTPAARPRTLAEDLQMLTGVLNQIRVNHPDSVSSHDLIVAAIRGMLGAADPHSYVLVRRPLSPEAARELADGRLVGVPIIFRYLGGAPVVMGTSGSAAVADILPGDELVAVDGSPVAAASVEELELDLLGRRGSRATLTFWRQRSDGAPREVERGVKREPVGETAVPAALMLDGRTGYLRITSFQPPRVFDEVRDAIAGLTRAGMTRLVLDLRDNPGGRLDAAAEVAGLFLPRGATVYIQEGRKKDLNDTVRVRRAVATADARRFPMVTLVNQATASAAELVAAALQDHDRSLLIGRPTFGKALVMTGFPLPDGSQLWLATSWLRTPCGRHIQRTYRGLSTREYNRRALARRDTSGNQSCRTAGGRTVYGGGGVIPDVELGSAPEPAWVRRAAADLVLLRWAGAFLDEAPSAVGSADALAARPGLPPAALTHFRAFAAREGAAVPDTVADGELERWLLPLVAYARGGSRAYHAVHARLDWEVAQAVAALEPPPVAPPRDPD